MKGKRGGPGKNLKHSDIKPEDQNICRDNYCIISIEKNTITLLITRRFYWSHQLQISQGLLFVKELTVNIITMKTNFR